MSSSISIETHSPFWTKNYQQEKFSLIKALGLAYDNGVIVKIAHIGSTSMADMPAKPCIDIAIEAYPTPLSKEQIAALENIGYDYLGENGIEGREYFRKGPHDFHVHIYDHTFPHWEEHITFRDYLSSNKSVAEAYAQLKLNLAKRYSHDRKSYQLAKSEFISKTLKDAKQWHITTTGFSPIKEVSQTLKTLSIPWQISSGWALDLFTKTPSRFHDDIDITIQRQHQLEIQRQLNKQGWILRSVVSGQYLHWENGTMVPEESHQIHAFMGNEMLDILLEPNQQENWIYRRNPVVHRSIADSVRFHNTIPYLSPEIVLLFKAKIREGKIRSKDQNDFERTLPHLNSEQKEWLKEAVRPEDSNHPWIAMLT